MATFTPTGASIAQDISFGLGLLSSFGQRVDVVGIYSNGPSGQSGLAPSGLSSSVLDSLLGQSAPAPSFGQQFALARPLKALVRETSKVMSHPVETGSMLADHHIINPIEIDMPMMISSENYASVYGQIRQNYINATALSVKTRTGIYQNMIIADMPHEENPELFTSIIIVLRLFQVLLFAAGSNSLQPSYQPLAADNSNTLASGLKSASAIGTKLLTSATSIASYANLAGKF